jgi:ABC-type Fe3+/spermidine/putrescine transport system ATPase subunit
MPNQPYLSALGLSKSYGATVHALVDIDLVVARGEIVCLLGPSGCGKTTLLRIVAGLEQPDRGRLLFEGRELTSIAVHRRGFGLMFQDFALFPHRTVQENVAFGLRMAGWDTTKRTARVEEMLELVNLAGFGPRSVFELSGGERQRVALARSLAPGPALLMLDEPLGSLDRGLRESLVEELRGILKRMSVTALYVTHDQDEALALGDRIAIMRQGRIEQIDAPPRLYTHPANPFVARFLGFTNLIPASPFAGFGVTTPLGQFPLADPPAADATLLILPEAARLALPSGNSDLGFQSTVDNPAVVRLHARLVACTYHGNHYRIQVEAGAPEQRSLLAFQLPTFQRDRDTGVLKANLLPDLDAPISLDIYTDLAVLLPYKSE